jgi:hypothetical protein
MGGDVVDEEEILYCVIRSIELVAARSYCGMEVEGLR